MGRHNCPNPPAPPQAKTAAISQARQAASQAYHARSGFSSLNSRQPNPASLSIVVEDDGLTSYDEAEGDDSTIATAAASAGGGDDRGHSHFTSKSSLPPPAPPPQPLFPDPAAGRQMNYRIIGFGKEHEEYHPAYPQFDNPAPVGFSAFGGPSAALAPPHPHGPNGLIISPPFGPHHAQAQAPHHALSGFPPPPIRGPPQSAFQPPPISGPPHSAISRPPTNVPLQSAFPPPLHAPQSAFPLPSIQGRPQSAFPPPAISGSAQSAFPPPPANGLLQSVANNSNNIRLGRQRRWGVSPEQATGMHPHCQSEPRPPWREQQQHHHHQQQPQLGRTWVDGPNGGGWQYNQDSKQGQRQGGWGHPVPTAHHGSHQTHWGPRGGNVPHGHSQPPFNGYGGHNNKYNQLPLQIQDLSPGQQPQMSHQRQQHYDHGHDLDQMDVTVSEETATAFLNNVFTDLQASGVAAYLPVTTLNHVNQSMECVPMDTSPNFYGPSVVVVDNVIHDQDMNMDVDSQLMLPPSNAYSQALVHVGAGSGYGFGPGYGYGAVQPGPLPVVPYTAGPRPALLPLPPEDIDMEVVVHDNRNHHRHPSSDAMMVDSPKPSSVCVLGSNFGGGGAGAADSSALAVVPFNGHFYEPEPVPAKVKAKPKALPAPEDVRSSSVAAKAKPQPVAGGPKSKGDVGKVKSQPVKDKGKVGHDKENIAVNPKSAVDASKAKASTTKVKAKPKAQSVVSADEPRLVASAGPSGFVHDEKARLVPVPSQPVKDKGKANAQSEVVKDKAQSAVSKAKGKAKADLATMDDRRPSKSRPVDFEDKPRAVVVPDKAQSTSNKGKSKAFSVVDETKSPLDSDNPQAEFIVKSAVDSNPFSPENFDSLDDEQALLLVKSQLAKAENLLAELQSQSSYTPEAPPPLRLVQARKPKLDAKAQSDVVPQCSSTYTPECTPPRQPVQVYNVDVEQNGGNVIQSPISYTPKDMPHNRLVRTNLDKDAQHAVVKSQPSSTYTPKDTPPYRVVQVYEPDLVQRDQASLLSVTQSAPPALVGSHSVRVEYSKAKPRAAGVEQVDTPMYALPALSPATGGSTYEVVDTFRNVKAFRPSAPCTPPTPSPLPTPLLSATRSDDNCFTADLIDFDNEFSSLTLNELSSVESEPLICFDKVQPSTLTGSFDWTASSSVWDDLAGLDQFFVSSTISVGIPAEVSPEELSIDDMLSEKFSACLSLLDKPLLDLTTPDEVERGCESRPFNVVPLMTETDCPVQLTEPVGKYDEAVRINDRIEAAAQEIQDINHRLLLNIESVRPMRVYLKVNKRKVGSKLRPTKNRRTPRYIESRTQTDEQPVKRIRASVSDDSNNVVIAVPVGSSTISLTLSSHNEPASKSPPPPLEQSVEPMSIPMPEANLAPPQKVMPGHFPLDESEVQYGPGISVLLKKLLHLCFGW